MPMHKPGWKRHGGRSMSELWEGLRGRTGTVSKDGYQENMLTIVQALADLNKKKEGKTGCIVRDGAYCCTQCSRQLRKDACVFKEPHHRGYSAILSGGSPAVDPSTTTLLRSSHHVFLSSSFFLPSSFYILFVFSIPLKVSACLLSFAHLGLASCSETQVSDGGAV